MELGCCQLCEMLQKRSSELYLRIENYLSDFALRASVGTISKMILVGWWEWKPLGSSVNG